MNSSGFRQEQEFFGDISQHHRNVHVADVVGDEHVVAARLDAVEAFDGHLHPRDAQQRARPGAGYLELPGRRAIEQRNDEADDAEKGGGENDQGDDVDPAPEDGHRLYSLLPTPAGWSEKQFTRFAYQEQ